MVMSVRPHGEAKVTALDRTDASADECSRSELFSH